MRVKLNGQNNQVKGVGLRAS